MDQKNSFSGLYFAAGTPCAVLLFSSSLNVRSLVWTLQPQLAFRPVPWQLARGQGALFPSRPLGRHARLVPAALPASTRPRPPPPSSRRGRRYERSFLQARRTRHRGNLPLFFPEPSGACRGSAGLPTHQGNTTMESSHAHGRPAKLMLIKSFLIHRFFFSPPRRPFTEQGHSNKALRAQLRMGEASSTEVEPSGTDVRTLSTRPAMLLSF